MFAAWHQFNKVVQLLAENGAELDIRDSKGRSPLFLACLDCDIKAVEMLLKKGARANDQDNEGNVLLFQFSFSLLFFFFFFSLFSFFFFFGLFVCLLIFQFYQTPLLLAVDKGHLDIAKLLIEYGANPNFISASGNTPLIIATE